ncbi:uncharacterized protein LOC117244870 [Parus major]|uniref:uncharacterized protein LOC117244870 n=1 Tax=Parus major TaxID=9157 RepID=UPI001443F3C2|nr:uncharacterized protein LOC117244870 [Parus major]
MWASTGGISASSTDPPSVPQAPPTLLYKYNTPKPTSYSATNALCETPTAPYTFTPSCRTPATAPLAHGQILQPPDDCGGFTLQRIPPGCPAALGGRARARVPGLGGLSSGPAAPARLPGCGRCLLCLCPEPGHRSRRGAQPPRGNGAFQCYRSHPGHRSLPGVPEPPAGRGSRHSGATRPPDTRLGKAVAAREVPAVGCQCSAVSPPHTKSPAQNRPVPARLSTPLPGTSRDTHGRESRYQRHPETGCAVSWAGLGGTEPARHAGTERAPPTAPKVGRARGLRDGVGHGDGAGHGDAVHFQASLCVHEDQECAVCEVEMRARILLRSTKHAGDQDTKSQECPHAYCKAEVPCPQPGGGISRAGKIRDAPRGLGEADGGHG